MFILEGFWIIIGSAVVFFFLGLAFSMALEKCGLVKSTQVGMGNGSFERRHNSYEFLSSEKKYAIGECLKLCQKIIASPQFDRNRAQAAIESIYRRADLAEPVIIWTKSPLACHFAKTMVDGLSDKESDYNGLSLLAAQLGCSEDPLLDQISDKVWRNAWRSLQASSWPKMKCPTGKPAWGAFEIAASGKRWKNLESLSFHMVRYLTKHRGAKGLKKFYVSHVWWAIDRQVFNLYRNASKAHTWCVFTGDNTVFHDALVSLNNQQRDDLQSYASQMVDFIIDSFLDARYAPNDQQFKSDFMELFHFAGWVRPFQHVCFVSEPHETIKFDEDGQLHCETGPSISYPDGFAVYAWHGTLYPSHWAKKRPSAKEALAWKNIEQRRVACEMVGWDKIVEELGGIIIDKATDPEIGELLRVDIPEVGSEFFLQVKCGTGRDFVMPVPPEMKTAREANAWTWGLKAHEYMPEVRT